jgi:SAM-dependent methyltransferase
MANIDHTKDGWAYSAHESLGNFFHKNWPGAIFFGEGKYFKHGTRLIGRAMDLHNPQWTHLSEWIDYIAFEEYQTGALRGLNVGCGNGTIERTFRGNYFINSDINTSPWSDFEFDITKKWPFPTGFFEHIVANNVLEHVDDLIFVCSEVDRCLQTGGVFQIEVPFIGSYNHGTDVTHRRGLTYESFNFLFQGSENYLYRDPGQRVFDYRCVSFHREIVQEGILAREILSQPPQRGSYQDWIKQVKQMIIPGT